jgi:hypothetical protein
MKIKNKAVDDLKMRKTKSRADIAEEVVPSWLRLIQQDYEERYSGNAQ